MSGYLVVSTSAHADSIETYTNDLEDAERYVKQKFSEGNTSEFYIFRIVKSYKRTWVVEEK